MPLPTPSGKAHPFVPVNKPMPDSTHHFWFRGADGPWWGVHTGWRRL